jgi:excisionase family DNA binding protein
MTNSQSATQELPAQVLMRPHTVATRLGVSERWVRDHATRRFPKLPVVKLGPLLRFRSADVDEFVERQRDDHSGTRRTH